MMILLLPTKHVPPVPPVPPPRHNTKALDIVLHVLLWEVVQIEKLSRTLGVDGELEA